jgi:hypothetical protein
MSHNPQWAVTCLCNHRATDHGLTDYEAFGKLRAPCSLCTCQVFEEDATNPVMQSWMDAMSDAGLDDGLDDCANGV